MKKVKIIYSWHDLGSYAYDALSELVGGIYHTLWSIFLLVANLAATIVSAAIKAIRLKPLMSVCVTFVYMLVVMSVHHAQMKVRLTTAEWQRDSLELRLDSIKVMDGGNVTYYRYRPYKGE